MGLREGGRRREGGRGGGLWWLKLLVVLMVVILQPLPAASLPRVIKIGGLFDLNEDKQETGRQEKAFLEAVDNVNKQNILGYTELRPHTQRIPPYNSFLASKKVCYLIDSGVTAIFGPQSSQTSAHVQSICDALEIPHIETRWDYRLRRNDYSVNLYPHPASLSKAYLDLVRLFKWKSFCIVYEDNEGLVRLQELLKSPAPGEFTKITIRQLPKGNNFRPLLQIVKDSLEQNIIVDCSTEKVGMVLKQAQQIGMMSPYYNYIITSLDLHLVDLEDVKYGGANVTAFRIVNLEGEEVKRIMANWDRGRIPYTNLPVDHNPRMKTETALMYDAVKLFVKAISALDKTTTVSIPSLKCDGESAWAHGSSLINYMKLLNVSDGLTGLTEFDGEGFRTDFDLDIMVLGMNNLTKVGTWSISQGINYTQSYSHVDRARAGMNNATYIVTMALNDPYIMLKESEETLEGNDRYEGFCIDLLNEVAKRLNFTFELVKIENNVYGNYNQTSGKWNGMIKALIDKKADMAITDLTINHDRESAVDFTMPFMNTGISILYMKPRKMNPSLFSFLSPLSLEVWMYMITAYIGVSVIMYILARFTPYEWQNPHPCDPEPDSLENQFTILNCLWFAIGSLMQQGCDFLPQAVSTRMVAGMWWFFTLIMISSYTANLAAFLTVERMESPIESAEDLSKQTKIHYGSMASGTTTAFFKHSNIATYQRMWKFMSSTTPSVFVRSNSLGVERVAESNGKYAFLMESTSIEYVVQRNCDLTQVGGLLDSKSYGIALPTGSPYTSIISNVILSLHESSTIELLKRKWWMKENGCPKNEASSGGANELGLSNVGGVFVVLLGGMGLALVVAMCEFLLECWDIAKDDQLPMMDVLSQELRFVFKCKGSSKPVRKKASESSDVGDPNSSSNIYGGSDVYNYTAKNPLT